MTEARGAPRALVVGGAEGLGAPQVLLVTQGCPQEQTWGRICWQKRRRAALPPPPPSPTAAEDVPLVTRVPGGSGGWPRRPP